jgi:hypothetical protein
MPPRPVTGWPDDVPVLTVDDLLYRGWGPTPDGRRTLGEWTEVVFSSAGSLQLDYLALS